MRNYLSKFLMFLMTASLIGIVFVQLYWLNNSIDNNLEQFKYHIKQVLGNVVNKMEEDEVNEYIQKINNADNLGLSKNKVDLTEFGYYEKDKVTNQIYIYKNTIESIEYEDFILPNSYFDDKNDTLKIN